MANVKITELTAYANPASTDVIPIVDLVNDQTKKVALADIFQNFPDGTAAAPSIAFDGDSNTGIYRPGADQLAISTGGSQALYINADGDILVADGNRMEIDEIRARDGAGLKLFDDAGAGIFVQDGGNVGVGTSSPDGLLTLNATPSNTPNLRFQNQSASADAAISTFGDASGVNLLIGTNTYVNSVGATAKFDAAEETAFVNFARTGNIQIRTGDGSSEAVRIDSSGRVGIGTTSPSKKLEVRNDGDYGLKVGGESSSSYYLELGQTGIGGSPGINYTGTSASFKISNNGTEVARFDSSGRLLVGTSSSSGGTNNTTELVVNGGMRSRLVTGSGNTTFTPNYTFQDGLYAIAYRVTGQDKGFIGYVSCINGNATITTLTNRGSSAPTVVAGPQIRFPTPGGNYGKRVTITLLTGLAD